MRIKTKVSMKSTLENYSKDKSLQDTIVESCVAITTFEGKMLAGFCSQQKFLYRTSLAPCFRS
jgi:hypothetical protein